MNVDRPPPPSALEVELWPKLVACASRGETTTFGELASQLGYRGARPLIGAVRRTMQRCSAKGWPPLTLLVLNRQGRPGTCFGELDEAAQAGERRRVYGFAWPKWHPDHERS